MEKHPSWAEMVTEAVAALKERHGSHRNQIKQYIVDNFNVEPDQRNFKASMKRGLASAVETKKLMIVGDRGGLNGHYKLGEASKKKKNNKEEKPTSSKTTAKSTKSTKIKINKPKVAKSPKNKSETKPPKAKTTKKKSNK